MSRVALMRMVGNMRVLAQTAQETELTRRDGEGLREFAVHERICKVTAEIMPTAKS